MVAISLAEDNFILIGIILTLVVGTVRSPVVYRFED